MIRLSRMALLAAGSALFHATPAAAQFEIVYPDTPREDEQTLLEWADPPILKHTIPEEQRGDTTTCGAKYEWDLGQAAMACWPLLRAAQLYTLAEFAAGETNGDRDEYRRRGMALADEAIAFIGTPEWPLEEYFLIKSLELKLNAQRHFEDWQAARATGEQLIAVLKNDLYEGDEFRLSFAFQKQGEALLKLGEWERAKALLEDARGNLDVFDGEKNAMRFSDQSEDIIIAAINRGEIEYAGEMASEYLDYASALDPRLSFGFATHVDLLLYLAARRNDTATALLLLEQRFARQADYSRCRTWQFEFPRVLGRLAQDKRIAKALIDGGCTPEQLDTRPSEPLTARGDKTLPALAP